MVVIVFQDESESNYYKGNFDVDSRDQKYELDIKAFREKVNELNILNPSFYRGIIMQVEYSNLYFKGFLDAIVNGAGKYSGEYGLNDSPFTDYLKIVGGLKDGSSTQSYYRDFIANALIDLGFKINQ